MVCIDVFFVLPFHKWTDALSWLASSLNSQRVLSNVCMGPEGRPLVDRVAGEGFVDSTVFFEKGMKLMWSR